MNLETRNFTFSQAMLWIFENNPNVVSVHYNNRYEPDSLVLGIPVEQLNLPDGWYYDKKLGITNKNNTTEKIYSRIKIVQQQI